MLNDSGQVLFHEIADGRSAEIPNGFLLDNEVGQAVKCGHPAQHIGSITEVGEGWLDVATVCQNGSPQASSRASAGRSQTLVAAIDEVVPKHQPEMSWMLDGKPHEGQRHCTHIGNNIRRTPGTSDVIVSARIGENGNLGQQSSGAAEVVGGSCWRDTSLSGCRPE